MVQEFINVLKNYANFSGRARRHEFWMFCLANLIIGLVMSVVALIPFLGVLVSTVYSLAILIPSLAVAVRRLHDVGKSGWWLLICAIPLVGAILLLVWFCTDSKPEENQWGFSPKYGAPAAPVAETAAPVAETVAPVAETVAPATIVEEEPAGITDVSAE